MASFIRDLLSVGLSKGGIIFFGLIQNIIIARVLGPELNGVIAALIVYPSLFMIVGSLGVRQSTAYYIAKGTFSEEQIKTAVSQIWILSTVFSLLVTYVLITYFSNSGKDELLVLLAIAPIPFALFNTYNSGVYLGKNEIQSFNKINWLPPLFVLLAVVLFVVIIRFSVAGVLLAKIIGPLIMSLIMLFKNRFIKAFSFHFEFKVIKSLMSLGIVYAIALMVINLNYRIDVILIDKLSTNYATGIYSKGAALIEYMWQIPMLLSTIIFARSANSKNSNLFSYKVCQLLRISIAIIILACIVLAFLAPWIIDLLYGEEFLESGTVLRLLIPGVVLLTIFKVLNMDMAGRGKPWISLKAMVPALLLNMILNIIWIPKYAANGASLASTISYSIAAVLFLFVYSKETGIPVREILGYRMKDFRAIQELAISALKKSKVQNEN